ncbi:MAG: SDR family NAD(P)-dependent oxidoreductase [Cyanobacteria bacterium P01_D01_bin.116]
MISKEIQQKVAKLKSLPTPDKLDFTLNAENICLITDDGTPLSIELAQSLVKQGWRVVILSFPSCIVGEQLPLPKGINRVVLLDMSEEHLKQQLSAIENDYGAVGGFIHLNPFRMSNNTAKIILKQVFLIAKYLQKSLNTAAKKGRSWFVTVSRLDGELGIGNKTSFNPIDGGLFGLTKTLNLEWEKVFCREIDISSNLGTQLVVDSIITELYDPNKFIIEVGYSSQGRVTLIGENDSIIENNYNSISKDAVFLVTGGGRGITAQCTIKLAKYCQCKFILLGRSQLKDEPEWAKNYADEIELKKQAFSVLNYQGEKPKPTEINKLVREILANREIKNNLQKIEQLGGQAEYLSVDITDNINLPRRLDSVVEKFGQITGIIHGAGVLADKLIENKTGLDFERVYSTKIAGLENILDCVNSDQIKHLILFSSAAGFYGNIGQSDYAIANEILNKFAHQFKHKYPECQVISFNWGPWESGMVTPELKEVFAQRGIEVIPVDTGTNIFVNQLIAGNSDVVQILVGSKLVTHKVTLDSELKSYRIRRKLSLEANPFLKDHIIGNHPVLPTVFALAWLASTVEQIYLGYKFFSCENYKVLKGIVFDETLAEEYILDIKEIKKDDGNEIDLSVTVWSNDREGKARYHYQSNLKLLNKIPSRPTYEEFDSQQDKKLVNFSPYDDGTLFHGSSFQGIKRVLNITSEKMTLECKISKKYDDYWGQFTLQAFNSIAADIPFQCMLIWVRYFYDAASLPLICQKGEHYQDVPYEKTFYASMEVQSSRNTKLAADIIVHDEKGQIYSRVFGAEVTISKQLNYLFQPSKDRETQQIVSYWRNFLKAKNPIAEALYISLYKRFVGDIILENPEDFHSLHQQPRIYLANHQVGIESLLFTFAISGLSNSTINTVAKIEHQKSWVNELNNYIYSYPQLKDPELTFYFDRSNQGSMLNLLNSIKKTIIEKKRSLLVHVEGTRSLTCRQPVTDLSTVFIDLALELNLPIIPVKFVGGLPIKPLEKRLEFPLHYTYQEFHLGKAIYPEDIKYIGNLERKNLILERLNNLGSKPNKSFPNQADMNFEKEVHLWMKRTGVSEIYAVLYKVFEEIYNPINEVEALVKGISQGKLLVSDTPEGYWLGEFGKWLSGNQIKISVNRD